MLVAIYFLFFTISLHAVPAGMEHEIDRFLAQIHQSSPLLQNALSRFQTAFSSSLSTHTVSEYLATSNNIASASSPINKIIYGYVSYSDSSTNYTNFKSAGADNAGMYVLEVQFKSVTDKPDISPLLSNKTLLFVAYGSGLNNPIIYKDTDAGNLGGGNSHDSAMASIGGFTCINKTSRCTDTAGQHPAKTCNGDLSALTNQSVRAGFYSGNSSTDLNMFYYVADADFALCATSQSESNCMGGSC